MFFTRLLQVEEWTGILDSGDWHIRINVKFVRLDNYYNAHGSNSCLPLSNHIAYLVYWEGRGDIHQPLKLENLHISVLQ
jgi:hypothetical protein